MPGNGLGQAVMCLGWKIIFPEQEAERRRREAGKPKGAGSRQRSEEVAVEFLHTEEGSGEEDP